MIKAVFFDLYGTLAGFQPSRYAIQSEACADFGISVTPEGIRRGYGIADAYMADQNSLIPVRTRNRSAQRAFFAEYEKRVLEGCGIDVSSHTASEIWRRIRKIPYHMECFDDVVPAMENLNLSGFTIGLISNMNQKGTDLCESLGLTQFVDFAVTSREVGFEKPHSAIFLTALQKAGVQPEESIHIGDQIASDIEGAINVGINAVLIDRDRNYLRLTSCPRIETLSQLPKIITKYATQY